MEQALFNYQNHRLDRGLFEQMGSIRKEKTRLNRKIKVSIQKLVHEFDISYGSAPRILKNDLKLRSYKMVIEPWLMDEHKEKRKKIFELGTNTFSKREHDEYSVLRRKIVRH